MATSAAEINLPTDSSNNENIPTDPSSENVMPSTTDTEFISEETSKGVSSESVEEIVETKNENTTSDSPNENVMPSTTSDTEFLSEDTTSTEEDKAEEDGPQAGDLDSTEDLEQEQEKAEECIDILGNGLLTKKVLVQGGGIQTRPKNGDTVTLKICGVLEDGTQVEEGETAFILNDGDVIVALDLGVALMELGEKCELLTSSRYAYGELGRDPDIPKDASITFTLELINIAAQVDVSSLTFQERLQRGEVKRQRGNYLFGRADFSGAINSYTKAVKVLDDTDLNAGLDESDRAQLEDSWTKCYNNMAACQLKIDALDAAIRSAEKVLSAQPNNVKALFRMGKAYGAKGEVDKAVSYLKQAIQLDPESRMLHQELFTLTKRKNKEAESEKDLYRKMLGLKQGNKSSKAAKEKENKTSNSFLKWGVTLGGVAAVVASVGFAWYRNS